MNKMKVKLTSIEDVKEFNNIATSIDADVDLSIDHYIIDAKSIMGILSLNLLKVLNLTIHSDIDYTNKFEKWSVR